MSIIRIDPAHVPPRIVLSRKGSDAAWGGRPSLRLGEELISLPIPEGERRSQLGEGAGLRYSDLPMHPRVGAFHKHLKNIAAEDLVHLDPDLRPELRRDAASVNATTPGIFGQVGAAAQHLDNQDVGPGTLFLFFGWFREVEERAGREGAAEWRRIGRDEQTIWGWLEVKSMHLVNAAEHVAALPWATHHPHIAHWRRYGKLNRVYCSTERLSFAPTLPGAGVFRYRPALSLTRQCDPAVTRRQWCLPGFFRSAGLTYNREILAERCQRSRLHLDSAPIGQEFVSPVGRGFRKRERTAVARWLETLLEGV